MAGTDTSVLIVGAGPVGLMAAIILRRLGVDARVIDRRTQSRRAPAAHVINPRTFEICRAAGVDMAALMEHTTDPAEGGRVRWVTRLAGEELASLRFQRQDDSMLAVTPTPLRNLGQHHFERVLERSYAASFAAGEGPGGVEFGQQWERATQDEDGVVSRIRNLATGEVHELRSAYLIAADGAGSPVRKSLGIEMVGPAMLRKFLMVHFEANLRDIVGERPGILYWVVDPEASGTFVAHDIDREWVFMRALMSEAETPADYPEARCRELIWRAMGGPRPPLKVEAVHTWVMSAQVAARFRDRRIFLAGDAAHRFPPTGALGLNSGVQDVHGLAWRLAGVLAGWAPTSLLDSYELERRPIAQHNADRSLLNAKRLAEVPATLGVDRHPTTAQMRATLDDPAGRKATLAAIENQAEHFDMLGMQIGYCYDRGALIADPRERGPAPAHPCEYIPTTRPGARLPHVWLERGRARVSSLDLVATGGFTLLTSRPDAGWDAAVAEASIPIEVVGIGRDVRDAEGRWAEVCGVDTTGAVLVRPDQHIAWRARTRPTNPGATLREVLAAIMVGGSGRSPRPREPGGSRRPG